MVLANYGWPCGINDAVNQLDLQKTSLHLRLGLVGETFRNNG